MIEDGDLDWIRECSAEVIAGTGESITRKRLDTSDEPESFDDDFGEVTNPDELEYEEDVTFTGKVFFDPSAKLVQRLFGGETEGAAVVHVPAAVDVQSGDELVIRGDTWRVGPVKPVPLGGFTIVGATRATA